MVVNEKLVFIQDMTHKALGTVYILILDLFWPLGNENFAL